MRTAHSLVVALLAVPALALAQPHERHPAATMKHPPVTMAEYHPSAVELVDGTRLWLGGTPPMAIADDGKVLVQGSFTFIPSYTTGGTLCAETECGVAHIYIEPCYRFPPDPRPYSAAGIPTSLQFQPRFTSADGNTWETNVSASPSYVFTPQYGATYELGFCAWKPFPDASHVDVALIFGAVMIVAQ